MYVVLYLFYPNTHVHVAACGKLATDLKKTVGWSEVTTTKFVSSAIY